MMPSTRLHASSLAAGCLMATLLVAPAVPAQSPLMGWTTTHRVTTDSSNGQAPLVNISRTVRAGALTRTEMFDGDAAEPRMIMINDTVAGTVLSVMPAQKTGMLMGFSAAGMKTMGNAIHLNVVGKPESHTDDLGEGPTILGHSTRHYRTTGRTVMHYAGETLSCDHTTETLTDVWTTRDSIGPREPRPVRPVPAATAPVPAVANAVPALDSTAMRSRPAVRARPLRTESATTLIRDGARRSTTKVTDEVTELRYGPVDSTLFRAPPSYRINDMRSMLAAIDQNKMYEAMAPMMDQMFCGTRETK